MASLEDALRYADLVKIEDVDQVLFDFDLVSKPAMTMMRISGRLMNGIWNIF